MHVSAFDAISKKAGHDFTPQQDEKITDAARGAYEKYSVSELWPSLSYFTADNNRDLRWTPSILTKRSSLCYEATIRYQMK